MHKAAAKSLESDEKDKFVRIKVKHQIYFGQPMAAVFVSDYTDKVQEIKSQALEQEKVI